jgi:hypothetical protein
MFASFFLHDAGFGIGELSVFADLDLRLGELALSHRPGHSFSLTASAVLPVAQLLRIYDSQLQTAPLYELVAAHQRAERNFQAPPETRLSLAALIQRSKRGNSGSACQRKQ